MNRHALFVLELVYCVVLFGGLFFITSFGNTPMTEYFVHFQIDTMLWMFIVLNHYIVGMNYSAIEQRGDGTSLLIISVMSIYVLLNVAVNAIKIAFCVPLTIGIVVAVCALKFWGVGIILFVVPLFEKNKHKK